MNVTASVTENVTFTGHSGSAVHTSSPRRRLSLVPAQRVRRLSSHRSHLIQTVSREESGDWELASGSVKDFDLSHTRDSLLLTVKGNGARGPHSVSLTINLRRLSASHIGEG